MNNKHEIKYFLIAARQLRKLGKTIVERKTYGGCTELRATLENSLNNVVIYQGCRGHMRLSVNFTI